MIKSRFAFWAYGYTAFALLLIFFVFLTFPIAFPIGLFFGLLIGPWLFLVEFKRKISKIVIDENSITVSNYLGFGKKEKFFLSDFEECQTSMMYDRGYKYEYMYLIKDEKKAVIFTAMYHRNFNEMKEVLIGKIKYIGEVPFIKPNFKQSFGLEPL